MTEQTYKLISKTIAHFGKEEILTSSKGNEFKRLTSIDRVQRTKDTDGSIYDDKLIVKIVRTDMSGMPFGNSRPIFIPVNVFKSLISKEVLKELTISE